MKTKNNPFHRVLSISAAFAASIATIHAADFTWGGGNLNWTDASASGWNGGPPTASDTATINSGRVEVTAGISTAPISIGSGGQLWINYANATIANDITLNGISTGGAIINGDVASGNVNKLTGQITLNATSNIASWWNDKSLEIAGKITGSGGLILDRATTISWGGTPGGRLIISGGTNDYTGGTTINGLAGDYWAYPKAILVLGANNALPSGSPLALNDADLHLSGYSQNLSALTTTGVSSVRGGSATSSSLTLNTAASNTFGGTFGGGGSNENNFSFTKDGAGHFTISGAATYTGGTTVNAGKLTLVDSTTGSANYVVNGDLELNLSSGKQINGGSFNGTGNLIKSGTGVLQFGANSSPQTVVLTGDNSVIDVQGGVLRNEYGNNGWSGNKAGLKVASGAVFDIWDADTRVDELSGFGTINKGFGLDRTLTIGVNNGSGNFSGQILNSADLGYNTGGWQGGVFTIIKEGTGTQTLSGVNTYIGATTINGGTLKLDATGTIDNTSGVALGTNGTFDVSAKSGYSVAKLSGSGTVKGALSVSTQLAIGNSPGTASFDSGLTLDSATYIYEMTGGATPGVGSADLGNITGTLTITAGSILDLVELGTYTVGNKFTLFGYTTGITGTFDGLADGAEFNDDLANKWQIDYNDTTAGLNGGIGTSFVTITAVPEPQAALLGGLGLFALLRRRRN